MRRVLSRFRLHISILVSSILVSAALAVSRGHAQEPSRSKALGKSIAITVDLRDADRRIYHAHLTIPASPGPLRLLYPKWIPGEHGPTGPIRDLAGLRLEAAGKPITWERDPLDMYAFRCTVPEGANAIDVDLDYIVPGGGQFTSGTSATPQLALLSWNNVLLYPEGREGLGIEYAPKVRLPETWKFGTSLPLTRKSGDEVQFSNVRLEQLVDSPVLAGEHYRALPLTDGNPPGYELDMACDSEAGLQIPKESLEAYRHLATEADALFGARHFRHYHFLLTLSDHTAHFGLEHHESSDDRVAERMLVDPDLRVRAAGLLPHELVHSWNGKYRRPADLVTADYQQTPRTDLLWVYEGLTSYLGSVLTARSGLRTPEQCRDDLAAIGATLDHQAGRSWRPLVDTAVSAQVLYGAPDGWESWRRSVDFYGEGVLIWLEADAIIRRESHGTKSLDDFCRLFHGGTSGEPQVKPYTFDELVNALGQVVPYNWSGFFTTRLTSTSPRAPLGGIEACGWKVAYSESLGSLQKSIEESN